jgi:hypothetical protein
MRGEDATQTSTNPNQIKSCAHGCVRRNGAPDEAEDGDDATVVTEVFGFGSLSEENRQTLLREGGEWINGTNAVLESMTASLERLEKISTE